MSKPRTAQPCVSIKSHGFTFTVFHPEITGARGGHHGYDRTEVVLSVWHDATGWNTGKRHSIDAEGLAEMNSFIEDRAKKMQHFVGSPKPRNVKELIFKITGSLLRPEPIQNAAESRIVDAIFE